MFKGMCIVMLLLAISGGSANATVWNCKRTFSAVMGNNYQIPTVNITLNRSIPDNTVLYTYKHMTPGIQGLTNCKSTDVIWHSTLQNTTAPVYEGSISGVNVAVYPTSVPGLGISVNDADSASSGYNNPIKAYPLAVSKNLPDSSIFNMGMWVDIRLWKIAGNMSLTPGAMNFVGPTINQGLKSKVAADTFSDTTESPDPGKWFTASYSHIVGSVNIINSTCNLQGGDKIVNLGAFNGSTNLAMGKSEWKDASLTFSCPNASGYGGQRGAGGYSSSTGIGDYGSIQSNNTVKNNPLTVRIIPRTQIVTQNWLGNPFGGTISLDGNGARGYGVQLAWGDAGTLGSGQPSKPVDFNTPLLANSLNSAAYRATAYDINATAVTSGKDGTIKMAARFIRTTRDIMPGPATAAVEVVVGYD